MGGMIRRDLPAAPKVPLRREGYRALIIHALSRFRLAHRALERFARSWEARASTVQRNARLLYAIGVTARRACFGRHGAAMGI
jgi:hypothetical protein